MTNMLRTTPEHDGERGTNRTDDWRFDPVLNNDRREHSLMIPYSQLRPAWRFMREVAVR
jgi:hypothetical protein